MKTAKKTNNAGFTLIELIVVMALMAIIMGAILNFIQPTASLYSSTNAYLSQEEAVTTVYNTLNDDLTFATDVYVVISNEGDAFSVDTAAQTVRQELIDLGENPIQFNNCLVLDNVTIRDDTSKAKAKHATGSLRKFALTDPTNVKYTDVTTDPSLISGENMFVNYFPLEDLAFMDDFKFFFTVTAPLSGEEQVLSLKTEVLSATYDSDDDKYVFTDHYFSSDNAIEFVNINAGAATSNCRLQTSTSTTPYIYIFYNRRNKIPETTIEITYETYILNATGDEYKLADSFKAATGSNITQQIIEGSETKNILEPVSDTHVYYRTGLYSTTPSDLYIDGKVYYDLTNAQGAGIIKLYAVYRREPKSSVQYAVNVYNDSSKSVMTMSNTVPHGNSLALSLPDKSGYAGGYYAICGTTTKAELDNIKNDMDIYPYYYKNYSVKFQLEDGTPFKGGAFDIDEVQQDTTISIPDGLLDTVIDEANSVQCSYELVDPDVFSELITGNTIITIKETKVVIKSAELDVQRTGGWGDLDQIAIKNTTDKTINSMKITITYGGNLTYCNLNGGNALYSTPSYSGNTVVIIFRPNCSESDWGIGALAPGASTGETLRVCTNRANNIQKIDVQIIS